MDKEYTIKAIASKAKDWESQYGKFKSYLVQLEGNGEPVQINKKAESEAPQVGDKVFGKIEEVEFGDRTLQKFKAGKKPYGGGYQRDDSAIRAQWAIGQAVSSTSVQTFEGKLDFYYEALESKAKKFYAMVDRVKASHV